MNNDKIKKCKERMKDSTFIESLVNSEIIEERDIKFIIPGKPISYARERKSGDHFYNPNSKKMEKKKLFMLKLMTADDYKYTRELIESKDTYYVNIKAIYYVPIPVGDSQIVSIKKELGLIKPNISPDLDNYDKFIIDSLHSVVFDNDKIVTDIDSKKRYSFDPRTEITIHIERKIK